MKKILAMVLLASTMCLVGCNNANKGGTTSSNNGSTQTETASKDTNNTSNNTSVYKTENVKITNPDEALAKLKAGNERFVNDKSELINVTSERRNELLEGQSPYAVILSCSDSRVTPTTIFDAGLGEIFDVRVAGNVVDDHALGSIEYAVEHLSTPLIVVMGHESCGGVTAAYEQMQNKTETEGYIGELVETIEENIQGATSLDEAIEMNRDKVAATVESDPVIKHLIDEGKVKLVKAYYDLDGRAIFE